MTAAIMEVLRSSPKPLDTRGIREALRGRGGYSEYDLTFRINFYISYCFSSGKVRRTGEKGRYLYSVTEST